MKNKGIWSVHDTESHEIRGENQQPNDAFIVALYLEVTMSPSTMSKYHIS